MIYCPVNVKAAAAATATGTADAVLRAHAINVDLGFDQAEYGTLSSLVFVVPFTLSSLVAGRAADVVDRRALVVGATAAGAAAVTAQALATDVPGFAAARAAQGVAAAFITPAAYSLIAELFPAGGARRAQANSALASGVYIGGALASLSVRGGRRTKDAIGPPRCFVWKGEGGRLGRGGGLYYRVSDATMSDDHRIR